MPRISEFFGIIIAMFYNDHAPPHFHARYGGHEAVIAIDTLATLRGSLPRRALALVPERAAGNRGELADDWDRARRGEPLVPIAPRE